ncbi:MAG TPA: 2-amino-4-hydroxy-6-hydroxymethyldihydropteridine diphosphokinase [Pseudobacteroides sp.]|uniref:2-amino-4-hydroxy-6- hydroxymethyldihydropteridine diphosphokinase n=1 Tax=Pseudobacteroides sp. TaxID=1968840 RepID=UPI002F932F3B
MSDTIYIALGSNMGNREKNIEAAIDRIGKVEGTRIVSMSSLYETEPVGYLDQGRFLNAAARIESTLSPLDLLKRLQEVERDLGRVRDIQWGPRTIDIDILLYGDLEMDLPELTIPHPRMEVRAFVLVPLKDVYEIKLINGKDINVLIDNCDDRNDVKLYRCEVSE